MPSSHPPFFQFNKSTCVSCIGSNRNVNNISLSFGHIIVTENANISNDGGNSGGRSGHNGKGIGGPKVVICSIMFGALLMLTMEKFFQTFSSYIGKITIWFWLSFRLHGIYLDFGLNLLGFLGSIKNFFLSPNFGYKGLVFACVGFAASLFGTAISNGLIMLRKKMDPNIETPSKAPPTILNALTWSAQMDLSSNLKCQILNGIEIVLAKGVSVVFKGWVVILRSLNNVLGGVLFFTLARLTGLQKVLNNGKMNSEEDEKSDHIDETLKSG